MQSRAPISLIKMRHYSTSAKVNAKLKLEERNKAIRELLKGRKNNNFKSYTGKILYCCENLLDKTSRTLFYQSIKKLGGIYLIQYKYDPKIFYIGRTFNFSKRFRAHILESKKKLKLNHKFYKFANSVG